MGLMRALGSVATGYLEARVGQFEDIAKQKADAKAQKDKYAAEQAMRIAVQNSEIEKNAELNAQEKEKERERRKNDLLNLGFTDEFIATHGQYALGSDSNFSAFIKLGQDTYGISRWWDTPIIFDNDGGYKGTTVQEYLMSSGKTFDGDGVKNETKNRVNIPDSIADNQMQTDETSATTEKPKLYGKNLFFAKQKVARSEGKQYINKAGQIITGFQYEQNIGEKDFSGMIFGTQLVETDEGAEAQLVGINTQEFIPLDSTNGQQWFKNTQSDLIKDIQMTSYNVWDSKTEKTYTIDGQRIIYTNGEVEEQLTGIDPTLANSLGIDLLKYTHFPPPIAQTKVDVQYFNVPLSDFKALSNLTLHEKTRGTGDGTADLTRYAIPETLSTSAKNTIKSQATSLAGFSADKDFIAKDTLGQGTIMTFFGDSQSSQTANAFGSIVDSSLGFLDNQYAAYEQSRGTRGLLNQDMGMFSVTSKGVTLADELGLSSDDPSRITRDTFVNKVAEYYKEVRETLTENELNYIKSLSTEVRKGEDTSDYAKYIKDNNIDVTVTDNSAIASVVIDKRLEKDITTLDDLLSTGIGIKEDVKIRKTTAESKRDIADSRAINKYFPPSEAAMGADFESFVNNYITDPDNEEQLLDLINAVKNLTDDSQEQQSLLNRANQYIETGRKEKYPFSKEETPFRVRKIEREEVGKAEREKLKEELGLNLVTVNEQGQSDYSKVIENIGYVQPEKQPGQRVPPRPFYAVNKLIGELNTLEGLGDRVITKQMHRETQVLQERKSRIENLKEQIADRLLEIKQRI